MPVSAYAGALTNVEAVKSRLGVVGVAQDDLLQSFINAASRRFESLTNRLLKTRTYTNQLFNGNGQQLFTGDPLVDPVGWTLAGGGFESLQAWGRRLETPLTAVTSVLIDDVAQTIGDDPDTKDVQVIALNSPSGLGDGLFRANGWPLGINLVKITYSGGFTTIPDDLAEACILTAMAWYYDKDRGYIRLRSISAQGQSAVLEKDAIPTTAWEMLQPFIRPMAIGI